MKLDKIRKMFADRYGSLVGSIWSGIGPSEPFQRKVDEEWAEYLNGLDCTVLGEQEILDDFKNIVNHSAQGRICISLEEETKTFGGGSLQHGWYILVPKDLAEKALVLGALPDSWFPEKTSP